jgi:hypothetical protein
VRPLNLLFLFYFFSIYVCAYQISAIIDFFFLSLSFLYAFCLVCEKMREKEKKREKMEEK